MLRNWVSSPGHIHKYIIVPLYAHLFSVGWMHSRWRTPKITIPINQLFYCTFFEFETKRMPKFLWTSLHQLEWIVAASSGLFSIKEQFPQIKFPFDNYWLKLVYAGEFKLVLILNERKKNSLNKKHRIETAQKYMQQLRLIDIWFMGN